MIKICPFLEFNDIEIVIINIEKLNNVIYNQKRKDRAIVNRSEWRLLCQK